MKLTDLYISVNLRVKIFSIFVAFLENKNFKESVNELLALLNVDENESSESQLVSTYGIDSLKTISSVNINDQSQDPFEFINQRNLSLPPRLLAGSKEKRTYSPVTRSYIKRVTFSNDSTDPGMYSQASVVKQIVIFNYTVYLMFCPVLDGLFFSDQNSHT